MAAHATFSRRLDSGPVVVGFFAAWFFAALSAVAADVAAPLRLQEQVVIGERSFRLDALPDRLSLVADPGLVVPARLCRVQPISPRYPFGTIHAPRAVEAPNGDYLVFGVHGGLYFNPSVKTNHAVMWRSTDDGETWDEGAQPWQMHGSKEHLIVPFVDASEPGRIYTMSNASPDSLFTTDVVVRSSDDNGHTWTERGRWSKDDAPQKITGFPGGPVHMRGAVLGDGTWLWGLYYRDAKSLEGDRQFVIRSSDKGAHWTLLPAAATGGWQHPRWKKFMEGTVVSSGGSSATIYLRAPGGRMYEKRTTDGGLTWSETQETPGLVHPDAPPMVFRFDGGKGLIAFIHNRYDEKYPHHHHPDRGELWFATSVDDGRSWSEPRFLIAQAKRPDHPDPTASCDPDVSYVDLLIDGATLHLFVADRQRQTVQVSFSADRLDEFPNARDLVGLHP